MNPSKLFVYNRLISEPDYVEDVFCPEFISFIRTEYNLGGISDKNLHNLLLTLFYTYLTGNSIPIWKKDFTRLFGSRINKRKSDFFSMSGYTTQIWHGKRLLRRGKSRRYSARPEIVNRMLDIPCNQFPESSASDLWYDVMQLMCDPATHSKTVIGALYFFMSDPLTAFRRGAGALPFSILTRELSETIITSALESEGIAGAADEDFVRYAYYRYPKLIHQHILRDHATSGNMHVSNTSIGSAVFNARALWFFDQLRNSDGLLTDTRLRDDRQFRGEL